MLGALSSIQFGVCCREKNTESLTGRRASGWGKRGHECFLPHDNGLVALSLLGFLFPRAPQWESPTAAVCRVAGGLSR